MEIQKIFSDMYGEERLYSVLMTEDEVALFSEVKKNKNKKNRIELRHINSHRGLGRSFILGGGPAGSISAYIGKKKAESLDSEGASDAEIIDKSAKHAAKAGAALGALSTVAGGLTGAAVNGRRGAIRGVGSGLTLGTLATLGGYLGARKNAEARIDKRKVLMAPRYDY